MFTSSIKCAELMFCLDSQLLCCSLCRHRCTTVNSPMPTTELWGSFVWPVYWAFSQFSATVIAFASSARPSFPNKKGGKSDLDKASMQFIFHHCLSCELDILHMGRPRSHHRLKGSLFTHLTYMLYSSRTRIRSILCHLAYGAVEFCVLAGF